MQSVQPQYPIRWLNVAVLGVPILVSLTLVPWYGLTYGFDAFEWAWFAILMAFCELSITAGYHRLWSHSAYKAHPVLRVIFALGGACALQNDCITWASDHRRHHLFVDDNDKDPYSAKRGFWYSHFEWMIRDYPSTRVDLDNAKDLLKDPVLIWQRDNYLLLLLLTNVGLPLLLGWIHGDIWASLLLAGFLRLTLSQHFTYLINSAAHMWGKRTYDPNQTARDNWFIALFTFGEGYHNYHHTFAWDYRNGIRWYHYDPTKWLINICSWLRLATDLRSCSSYRVEMTRIAVQYKEALKQCESLGEANSWSGELEAEYEKLVATLNNWSNARHAWIEAKSAALSQELQEDLTILRRHYKELTGQWQTERQQWQVLVNSLSGSRSQAT